jgi:hypothetical protein
LKISVVICTADREASLARALESIAQTAPPRRATWEVVVVNNGCSGSTDRVIEGFRERLPIRRVFQPIRGISSARNAGVAAAAGDYLLWTDDDVRVGTTWMRAYESAFQRYPSAAFFGGPIRPRFAGTPPAWLLSGLPHVVEVYGGIDIAAHEVALGARRDRLPFGANMAIRGIEQRAHLYNQLLGRQPGGPLISGEETEMLIRVVGAGATGVWLPDATVEHWVEPARQTVAYLRDYYRGSGFTASLMAMLEGHPIRRRRQVGLSICAALLEGAYVVGRLLAVPGFWLPAMINAERLRGQLSAYRRGLPAAPLGANPE